MLWADKLEEIPFHFGELSQCGRDVAKHNGNESAPAQPSLNLGIISQNLFRSLIFGDTTFLRLAVADVAQLLRSTGFNSERGYVATKLHRSESESLLAIPLARLRRTRSYRVDSIPAPYRPD